MWELVGGQSRIIVNGVDFNEKYQLEGSYFPYEIKGKIIFVAKKNGKFSIMYDEIIVGPEFDQISMPYCCAMVPLIRGNGQYWFVGSREGIKYLVSIRKLGLYKRKDLQNQLPDAYWLLVFCQ